MTALEQQQILAQIDRAIGNMQLNGTFWSTVQCYQNKVTTLNEAYVLGYNDALRSTKEYILMHHLDKPSTRCYTSRKARKAHKK